MSNPPRCPVSDATDVSILIDLPGLPSACNQLWDTSAAARRAPRGDIRLGYSHTSGHAFNLAFHEHLVEYTDRYENALDHSAHFRDYAEKTAQRLIIDHDVRDTGVLDVGCGDGGFLRILCEAGRNRGVGVDPRYTETVHDRDLPITFLGDRLCERHLDGVTLVCVRQVLEHLPRPGELLDVLRRGLRPNGVAFFEVPNAAYMFEQGVPWDLVYEHCDYYSAASLTRLLMRHGFEIYALEETYGGQFLALEAGPVHSGLARKTPSMARARPPNALAASFAETARETIDQWRSRLSELTSGERQVVLWGAGSKGVTFLNVVGRDARITAVVDINPKKIGHFAAGTGHPIVAPEALTDVDVVLIANPVYRDEIRARLTSLGLSPELVSLFG